MKITGRQVAAARELLDMTQEELAAGAMVDVSTVNTFEKGKHSARPSTIAAIRSVLEARGIEFTNGDGLGVRLRFKPVSKDLTSY